MLISFILRVKLLIIHKYLQKVCIKIIRRSIMADRILKEINIKNHTY